MMRLCRERCAPDALRTGFQKSADWTRPRAGHLVLPVIIVAGGNGAALSSEGKALRHFNFLREVVNEHGVSPGVVVLAVTANKG